MQLVVRTTLLCWVGRWIMCLWSYYKGPVIWSQLFGSWVVVYYNTGFAKYCSLKAHIVTMVNGMVEAAFKDIPEIFEVWGYIYYERIYWLSKTQVELGESLTARTESLGTCLVLLHKGIVDAWLQLHFENLDLQIFVTLLKVLGRLVSGMYVELPSHRKRLSDPLGSSAHIITSQASMLRHLLRWPHISTPWPMQLKIVLRGSPKLQLGS